MSSQLSLASLALFVILAAGAANAQMAAAPTAPTDVPTALQALRDADTYSRSVQAEALVTVASGGGAEALAPIVQVVADRHSESDLGFVSHCIMALGQLKADAATDELLAVLAEAHPVYVYHAGRALGQIWEGRAAEPRAREVNGSLLGAVYRPLNTSVAYGPAHGLALINGISGVPETGINYADLLGVLDAWVAANPGALPPAEQQPWPLLWRRVVTGGPAARTAALDALRQQRALGPVGMIAETLVDANDADLAAYLGEMTGIPYPPQGAEDPVAEWRSQWQAKLAQSADARHVQYAWMEFERLLAAYDRAPTEENGARLEQMREVLVAQLPGPGDLPAGISPAARQMVLRQLGVKQLLRDSLDVYSAASADFEKASRLDAIEKAVSNVHGQKVGMQFVGRIYDIALSEPNITFAPRLGNVLTQITGLPCDLSALELEKRQAALREWLAMARKRGLPVNASAAASTS